MTLRDLTKRQIYNLRRRCEKERKLFAKKKSFTMDDLDIEIWRKAFDKGLKAGLSQLP